MRSEYIIEFIPQGRFMRVTAIDPVTGTEVVLVGDARETQEALKRAAVNKLEYIMKKQQS